MVEFNPAGFPFVAIKAIWTFEAKEIVGSRALKTMACDFSPDDSS